MRPEEIKRLIEAGVPGARAEVYGEDGAHYEAVVVAPAFAGKRTLDRHRMVYAALGGRVGREIHALSLRTLAPGEADETRGA
ncbi:MAG TPA: BolA/IbaG family iron-sulfur metabolism protein [Gammaproteobacteria bacterium]|nr:BolA/IbaG family iron-sulfur metabolism protein [Gammaproteobacteria bacterium]